MQLMAKFESNPLKDSKKFKSGYMKLFANWSFVEIIICAENKWTFNLEN